MKTNFKWIYALFLVMFVQFSFAQEKTVSGIVTEGGQPLPGVAVLIKGTNTGTQTDFDGNYSIKVNVGQTLVFTFIGFKTESVTVGTSNVVNVAMEADTDVLEGVVVEAYRTTAKAKSNIASTTITAKTIEGRPNASFIQSLQAQIPGLNIASGSGSPGSANTTIILRGVGSINGNIEPLFIIDGVPANQVNFRSINPNDIESVSVLKDAAATSAYGNRGANGVIVVKTKRGSYETKLQVRFTSTTGFTTLQEHDYRIMNSKQTLALQKEYGQGFGSTLTDEEIANYAIDTKWQDYFFRTGVTRDQNLSFTNGGKNTNSFISIGYFDQEGIVPTTNIKRFTLRSNFSGKSDNDKFNYALNMNAAYSIRNQLDQETRTDIDGNVLQNPLQGMLSSVPYLDPNVYENGQQLFDDFGSASFAIVPYMLMDYLNPGNITSNFNELKLLFNGSASYKITKDFTFSSSAGIDMTENTRLFARNPQSYLAIVAAASVGSPFPGLVQESNTRDFGFNNTNRLNYNKIIDEKHTIDVSVLTEYYKAHFKGLNYSQTGLDPRTHSPGAGTGYIPFDPASPNLHRPGVGASKAEVGLFSYFALADYDYDSKYGFGASIRRDASFRFVDDYKWGTFWSVSGRWNISKEKFMDGSSFDELKLRASYGTAGNQLIGGGNYGSASIVRNLYGLANGYGNSPSLVPTNIANRDARWETVEQYNLGVDFVFKKKLRGTIDVYQKNTIDLYQSRSVSPTTGVTSLFANLGDLRNSGIELLLGYDIVKNKDLSITLNANGSYNKNEFTSVPGEDGRTLIGDLQINEIGGPVLQYYNIPYVGVNPSNGNLLFLNQAGQLTETPTADDRRSTGKNQFPVYQGGFGFDVSYKGFFATTQFSFVKDIWRYDFDLSNLVSRDGIANFPQAVDMLNAWTPDNRITDVPSLFSNEGADGGLSDRWLRDASYLRLRFATVGYNVPSKYLDKTFLTSVRVFAQAENFLTWSKWRGFDPESNEGSTFGGYPTPKIVSFGLDLSF